MSVSLIQKYRNETKKVYFSNGIEYSYYVEVIPETVGQYIGLTDKNGEYSLRLAQTNKKGVVPGPYAVFLSWSDPNASENPIEGETEAAECPYNLPPRANSGELRFEVGDKGESAADFTFDSSEEPANVPVGI